MAAIVGNEDGIVYAEVFPAKEVPHAPEDEGVYLRLVGNEVAFDRDATRQLIQLLTDALGDQTDG